MSSLRAWIAPAIALCLCACAAGGPGAPAPAAERPAAGGERDAEDCSAWQRLREGMPVEEVLAQIPELAPVPAATWTETCQQIGERASPPLELKGLRPGEEYTLRFTVRGGVCRLSDWTSERCPRAGRGR